MPGQNSPTRSFHNTIEARGADLKHLDARAQTQEQTILNFFRQHVGRMFTPSEIHQRLYSPSTPLTSVRRAITNLTEAGHITKTDVRTLGPYGVNEHCWYVRPVVKTQSQLTLFGG